MRFARWTVVGVAGFALFMDYLIYGPVIPLTPSSPAMGTNEQLGLLHGGHSAGMLATTPIFVRYYVSIASRGTLLPWIPECLMAALTDILHSTADVHE